MAGKESQYEHIRVIGKGSFGSAVLVRDKDSHRQYVLKLIKVSNGTGSTPAAGAGEGADFRSVMNEVSVLMRIGNGHPNVCRYRDSFMTKSGELAIVMDFCNGGDLQQKIKGRRQFFSEDEVLDYFVQLCLGLKHIHDRKILHRDLKTSNIFIELLPSSSADLLSPSSVSAPRELLKIGDFGIARALSSTADCAQTRIGTPYYLSPEICQGRPYDSKSDVWSLGCVLYELCSLKHAFNAQNISLLALKILRGEYPPIPSCYSPWLHSLVASLLHQSPAKRPSVNELLRLPFIQRRIAAFLTEQQRKDEFSHTVIHGAESKLPLVPAPISSASSASTATSAGPAGSAFASAAMPLQQRQPSAHLASAPREPLQQPLSEFPLASQQRPPSSAQPRALWPPPPQPPLSSPFRRDAAASPSRAAVLPSPAPSTSSVASSRASHSSARSSASGAGSAASASPSAARVAALYGASKPSAPPLSARHPGSRSSAAGNSGQRGSADRRPYSADVSSRSGAGSRAGGGGSGHSHARPRAGSGNSGGSSSRVRESVHVEVKFKRTSGGSGGSGSSRGRESSSSGSGRGRADRSASRGGQTRSSAAAVGSHRAPETGPAGVEAAPAPASAKGSAASALSAHQAAATSTSTAASSVSSASARSVLPSAPGGPLRPQPARDPGPVLLAAPAPPLAGPSRSPVFSAITGLPPLAIPASPAVRSSSVASTAPASAAAASPVAPAASALAAVFPSSLRGDARPPLRMDSVAAAPPLSRAPSSASAGPSLSISPQDSLPGLPMQSVPSTATVAAPRIPSAAAFSYAPLPLRVPPAFVAAPAAASPAAPLAIAAELLGGTSASMLSSLASSAARSAQPLLQPPPVFVPATPLLGGTAGSLASWSSSAVGSTAHTVFNVDVGVRLVREQEQEEDAEQDVVVAVAESPLPPQRSVEPLPDLRSPAPAHRAAASPFATVRTPAAAQLQQPASLRSVNSPPLELKQLAVRSPVPLSAASPAAARSVASAGAADAAAAAGPAPTTTAAGIAGGEATWRRVLLEMHKVLLPATAGPSEGAAGSGSPAERKSPPVADGVAAGAGSAAGTASKASPRVLASSGGDVRSPDSDSVFAASAAKFVYLDATLQLAGVRAADSLSFRIESLRRFLEEQVDLAALLDCYALLKSLKKDDDEEAAARRVHALLGSDRWQLVTLIQQLIVCEERCFAN